MNRHGPNLVRIQPAQSAASSAQRLHGDTDANGVHDSPPLELNPYPTGFRSLRDETASACRGGGRDAVSEWRTIRS